MAANVEESQLRVYCPTHRINFEVPGSGRILCENGGHALALDFPHEGFWEYCCDCQVFSPSELDKGGKARESCPVCTRPTARRYLCHECKLLSFESDDAARRRSFRLGPRGEVEPSCPGCHKAAGASALEHVCEDAGAAFATARAKCPFCEEPVRRPSPAAPHVISPPAVERIFCAACGTQAAPDNDFCMNCGGPVGLNAARQTTRPIPPPPPPAPTPPGPVTIPIVPPPAPATPAPGRKSSAGVIVAVCVVGLLLAVVGVVALISRKDAGNDGGFTLSNSGTGSKFKERLDRALAANYLFSPSGECVADLYDAEAARSPNSPALAEAASKIRTQLEPVGDAAIQRYYAESDSTVDWDYISRVYGLLKKVAPDNREYSARYAYSLGLVNLKNKDYAAAIRNFQEALNNKPDWVMAYNGLGRVYVQNEWEGRYDSKVVEYYSKACELDTNFTWGCRNLGAYYIKKNQWSDAETYMTMALQRSPGRESIWKVLGTICPKVGKYQDTSTGQCAGGY